MFGFEECTWTRKPQPRCLGSNLQPATCLDHMPDIWQCHDKYCHSRGARKSRHLPIRLLPNQFASNHVLTATRQAVVINCPRRHASCRAHALVDIDASLFHLLYSRKAAKKLSRLVPFASQILCMCHALG